MDSLPKVSRRRVLQAAGLAGASAALYACTPGAASTAPTAAPTAAAPTAAPSVAAPSAAASAASAAPSAAAVSGAVEYWHHYAGNATLDAAIKKVFDAFQAKYPDIKFTPDAVPNPEYVAKLTTAAQTNTLPDVALIAESRFADALGMGALKDITERIKALPNFSDFPLTLMDQEAKDGKWYGLPVQVFPDGNLFYRKDWLDEAGFTKPPANWDEFQQIALKITDPAKKRYGFGMRGGDLFAAATLLSVIDSYGTNIIDGAGKAALDREKTLEAVTYYSELFTKHKVVPPSVTSDGYAQILAGFQTGQTGMLILGFGALSAITAEAKFPVDALGVDIAPGKVRPAVWQEALCNSMTNDRNAEASWAWMAFWADPDIQASFYADTGFLPSMLSAYDDPRVSKSKFIEAGAKAVAVGRPSPVFPGYTGYITDLTATFQAVLTGQMTPAAWTDDAIAKLKTLLG